MAKKTTPKKEPTRIRLTEETQTIVDRFAALTKRSTAQAANYLIAVSKHVANI